MLRTVLLLVGIALLVLLLRRLGPAEIAAAALRIGWSTIPIFSLYAAHHLARALALRSCVLRRDRLRYLDAVGIRLSGEAVLSLTVTGPLLAEPTRAWLLRRRGFSLEEGFAATITEYLIASFVNATLAIAALAYLLQRFEPAPAVSAVAIAAMLALGAFLVASAAALTTRFYLIGTVIAGLAKLGLLKGRLRPDMTRINRMEDLLLAVLRDRPGRLAAVAAIEAAAQAFLVLELVWLLHALELAVPRLLALVIEGSIKVTGIASLVVPMQMGVAEGAYALIFDLVGLPAAAGFAIALFRRVRSLAMAGIGLAALALLTRGRGESEESTTGNR